jgi:hypothetical protein
MHLDAIAAEGTLSFESPIGLDAPIWTAASKPSDTPSVSMPVR